MDSSNQIERVAGSEVGDEVLVPIVLKFPDALVVGVDHIKVKEYEESREDDFPLKDVDLN